MKLEGKGSREESLSWKERQGGMCGGQEAEVQSTKSPKRFYLHFGKAHENGPTRKSMSRIVKLLEQEFCR